MLGPNIPFYMSLLYIEKINLIGFFPILIALRRLILFTVIFQTSLVPNRSGCKYYVCFLDIYTQYLRNFSLNKISQVLIFKQLFSPNFPSY